MTENLKDLILRYITIYTTLAMNQLNKVWCVPELDTFIKNEFTKKLSQNRRDGEIAEIPDKVTSIINQFLNELEKNNISIERAILFGSYAHVTFNDWSDIDLAIVSKDFKGERFKDRNKIRRIKLSISDNLEPIPYVTTYRFSLLPWNSMNCHCPINLM